MEQTNYEMLIGGEWTGGSEDERFSSVNPYNREEWANIPQASEHDVDHSIYAAREAFEVAWKDSSGLQRARLMGKLADALEDAAPRLARLESTDNGKVVRETEGQTRFAARIYRFYAGYADKLYGDVIPLDNDQMFDHTLREPLGVAALITAWNSPLLLLAYKLAPALAAGNAAVVKPSEYTSATTLEFAKLAQEVGFPDGVINVVTGDGKVGDALTRNPEVDKISITGGARTGRAVARNAAENLVPLTLELGGKSPNIVFEDADLERAVTGALAGIFGAAGQTCIAGSRLLLQRPVYEEVLDELVSRTREIKLGDPLDPTTEMGPVATEEQFERILGMIETGVEEGAKLAIGGAPVSDGELGKGFFVAPTIFSEVDNGMTIAQEEIFGPVLSVIRFEDEEEAVGIANATKYGLASGLWTRDLSRAHRLSRRINAGTVWVNTYRNSAAQAPFGGVKQSGYGREKGWHPLLEYTRVKNVMIDLSTDDRDPFAMRS